MELRFVEDIVRASFLLRSNRETSSSSSPPGQTAINAYLDGSLVSEQVVGTIPEFHQFEVAAPRFDQIQIFPGGWGQYGRLDDLRFQSVPEPTSRGLLPLILVALVVVRRRIANRK